MSNSPNNNSPNNNSTNNNNIFKFNTSNIDQNNKDLLIKEKENEIYKFDDKLVKEFKKNQKIYDEFKNNLLIFDINSSNDIFNKYKNIIEDKKIQYDNIIKNNDTLISNIKNKINENINKKQEIDNNIQNIQKKYQITGQETELKNLNRKTKIRKFIGEYKDLIDIIGQNNAKYNKLLSLTNKLLDDINSNKENLFKELINKIYENIFTYYSNKINTNSESINITKLNNLNNKNKINLLIEYLDKIKAIKSFFDTFKNNVTKFKNNVENNSNIGSKIKEIQDKLDNLENAVNDYINNYKSKKNANIDNLKENIKKLHNEIIECIEKLISSENINKIKDLYSILNEFKNSGFFNKESYEKINNLNDDYELLKTKIMNILQKINMSKINTTKYFNNSNNNNVEVIVPQNVGGNNIKFEKGNMVTWTSKSGSTMTGRVVDNNIEKTNNGINRIKIQTMKMNNETGKYIQNKNQQLQKINITKLNKLIL